MVLFPKVAHFYSLFCLLTLTHSGLSSCMLSLDGEFSFRFLSAGSLCGLG